MCTLIRIGERTPPCFTPLEVEKIIECRTTLFYSHLLVTICRH